MDAEEVETDTAPVERDFDAEARQHGWTDKEAFKGDPSKWVDAKTFVKRADEVMPLLKKQIDALKTKMDEMKRETARASKFFAQSEERAYKRAMTDLQAKMDDAVEMGDVAGTRRILSDMETLKDEVKNAASDEPKFDPEEARREFTDWVEENDWYVHDADKRTYADLQAGIMGNAHEFPGGGKEYLVELTRRVEKKFAAAKPNPVNGGGNRATAKTGGKTFADLPAEAKRMCDKWVGSGLIKSRDDYVKSFDWSN